MLPPKVDILIILDENMENYNAVITEADKRHARVVKLEWLIQTVITGKMAPFDNPIYCILDQKTVMTEVKNGPRKGGPRKDGPRKNGPRKDSSVAVKPPQRRLSEESLLSVD